MFKVNNINSRRGVKYFQSQQKRHQNNARRRSGVFFVDFEHISHHVLVSLIITLSRQSWEKELTKEQSVDDF